VAGSVAYLVAGIRNSAGHSPPRVRHTESVLHVERAGNSILVPGRCRENSITTRPKRPTRSKQLEPQKLARQPSINDIQRSSLCSVSARRTGLIASELNDAPLCNSDASPSTIVATPARTRSSSSRVFCEDHRHPPERPLDLSPGHIAA
jgi:hypothetical protein